MVSHPSLDYPTDEDLSAGTRAARRMRHSHQWQVKGGAPAKEAAGEELI